MVMNVCLNICSSKVCVAVFCGSNDVSWVQPARYLHIPRSCCLKIDKYPPGSGLVNRGDWQHVNLSI